MILSFPNRQTFEVAIRSGVVPPDFIVSPAQAVWAETGALFIQPKRRTNAAMRKAIVQLGGEVVESAPEPLSRAVDHWLELMPLIRRDEALPDNTPVIFELKHPGQLADMAWEMLRLGNDRQSFRHLASKNEDDRTLLLVHGPPYYSLLRAFASDADSPRAYYLQGQRVWSQVGWRHPLGDQIEPAAGEALFLKEPDHWETVAEAPFRDVYEILQFQLPASNISLHDAPLQNRIAAPLSLKAGGANQVAELWVLTEEGTDQLDTFVRNADDQLVDRLAFAVGNWNDKTHVVLRVRPSREAPPLVIDGVACRSYLGLDNLFVPCGSYVHPPLRRDAIADLIAPRHEEIVWLQPGENGSFVPHSIPDDSFRPLAEWVDYVVDSNQAAVSGWMQATQFQFEAFVCRDDETPTNKPPDNDRQNQGADDDSDIQFRLSDETTPVAKKRTDTKSQQSDLDFRPSAPLEISELQQRLNTLEQKFLAMDSPLESPERTTIWYDLARVHIAMNHRLDGLLCYSNAAWEDQTLAMKGASLWYDQPPGDFPPEELSPLLQRLEKGEGFQVEDGGYLAVLLMWASFSPTRPEWITSRLGVFAQRLESFEKSLSLRTVWLAWRALVKLSQGDTLALARARDRALGRLYESGLRPELDLPTFLRVAGQGDSARLRSVRDALPGIASDISMWIEQSPGDSPFTQCYCDLAVAWAWGRLGEATKARELRNTTLSNPAHVAEEPDALHEWLCDAYSYRIEQAILGSVAHRQWSPELADRLNDQRHIDVLTRHNLDRFLFSSDILDPHETLSQFARAGFQAVDVSSLVNLTDADEIRKETIRRINETESDSASAVYGDNLAASLQKSPLVGEAFAIELLNRAARYCDQATEVVKRGSVLCQAFRVAAHFGLVDHVDHFVQSFRSTLSDVVVYYLQLNRKSAQANHGQMTAIEELFREIFRGFRKFGLRDEVSHCVKIIREVANDPSNQPKQPPDAFELEFTEENRIKRLLLTQLEAEGWLLLGENEQAMAATELTREFLFTERPYVFDAESNVHKYLLPGIRKLLNNYIVTVGQMPFKQGLPLFEEIFNTNPKRGRRLVPISDMLATTTHCVISQLAVVEAVMVAIVSEDFTLNQQSRRLLEEDEFLVRRRIHADAAAIM